MVHLQVGARGNLGFRGVRLSKLAPAEDGDASGDNVVQALAVWPTITGEPGAVVCGHPLHPCLSRVRAHMRLVQSHADRAGC